MTADMRLAVHGTAGPAVVLLHGIPGSARTWDGVVARLAAAHRVAVPDLLGFGASARPGGFGALRPEAQAAALERALDDAGIGPAVLAGHDYGGPVALTLLRRRPELVAGLALLATNTFTDTPIPLPIRAVTWPVVGGAAERLLFSAPALRMMIAQGARVPVDAAAHVGDARQRAAIRTIFGTVLRDLRTVFAPIEEALASVQVPAVVVWGDRDPFFPVAQAERTAAAIPGARLTVHAGCGHFVPDERPDEVAEELAALVRAARPAARTAAPA